MKGRALRLIAGVSAVLGLIALVSAGGREATSVRPVSAATDIVPLAAACNNEALTWPANTPLTTVAAGITPAGAMESIWRFDNAEAKFYGFSLLPGAPNDYVNTVARLEPVFICMRMTGQLDRPTV